LSLARLLDEHRPKRRRDLTREQILAWADAHHAATGRWPNGKSGPVAAAPGETWDKIDQALRHGYSGLPSGSSLARLLRSPRARRRSGFTLGQILAWGRAHHAATGRWPTSRSGPVAAAPGETWKRINYVLVRGSQSLPSGLSLARLFRHPFIWPRPRLTVEQVLAWSEAHRAATGQLPNCATGAIPGAPGETWSNIDKALREGHRGLPSGMTLRELLVGRRDPRPTGHRRGKPSRRA
jgi:hypothetical protein